MESYLRVVPALLLSLPAPALWAQPPIAAQRLQRHATLYQGGFAFFYENWQVHTNSRQPFIAFSDLPTTVDPSSIAVVPQEGELLWQRFRSDLDKEPLEQLQGQTVRFISSDGQQVIEGKLLKLLSSYALLQTSAGLLLLPSPTQYRVLIEGDSTRLAKGGVLQALVRTRQTGVLPVAVHYIVEKLSWRMRYLLRLPPQGTTLTMCGFALLENHTEAIYDSASISLVAGSVSRPVRAEIPSIQRRTGVAPSLHQEAAPEASPPAEFSGFYRYQLPYLISLRPLEHVQLPLIPCRAAQFERLYRIESHADFGSQLPVTQLLRLINREQNGLGEPLPAGVAQILAGSTDSLGFAGEISFPETPVGDTLVLALGPAFDLKARQQLLERREIAGSYVEESYQISILNGGREAASVELRFHLRWDQHNWRITSSTHPHWRYDATTAAFRLPVAAGSESILRFTVQSQRPPR
ncbi:MAG: hypothetical protein NZ473_03255 [Candidatus Kapabacteria bacterium]|nr:hypothetical protein [Candidatus Kapabacteria bacterium]MCS7169482.1 hypothetical protein [Candidatus Kapabacteria bacterium]MDW7996049.1 hypothetical protein [Bacteroidota bacterium]